MAAKSAVKVTPSSCQGGEAGSDARGAGEDGSLRAITREATFGEVDRSQHGLIELPAQERHGLIWMVGRAAAPIDVAAWLGPEMDEILSGYRLGELAAFRSDGFRQAGQLETHADQDLGPYVTEGHYLLPNSTLLRGPVAPLVSATVFGSATSV